MRTKSISRFCISILLFAVSLSAIAQDTESEDIDFLEAEVVVDTIKPKEKYGLRVGIDLFKPILSIFDEDKKGFEIVADYRITKNIFLATEFGTSDRNTEEDYLNFNTKGIYFKLGANFNLYENWTGMSNEILIGIRYGFSKFDQTLYEYSPNFYGTYFEQPTVIADTEYNDLSAHWGEIVIGLRVEVFNNLYMGMSISLKKMIQQEQPENFLNMYIPGFERVYVNETGFSFNYTVSYLIPFTKK